MVPDTQVHKYSVDLTESRLVAFGINLRNIALRVTAMTKRCE